MFKWLSIVVIVFLSACSENQYVPEQEGPNGSWWVGGIDGGVYVFIEDDANTQDNNYQGVIYYEFDKTVWYQGKFEYNGKLPLDYKNRNIYDGWDGENLFLKDKSILKAINPPD